MIKNEGRKMDYSLVDVVLLYLPTPDYSKKSSVESENLKEESTLETELEEKEIKCLEDEESPLPVRYSQNLLSDHFEQEVSYQQAQENMFYTGLASDQEDESLSSKISIDDDYTIIEEVRDSIEEEKYADISKEREYVFEEEERVEYWRKLHPAEFELYLSLFCLNRDTNYGSL